jgi:WhiB family transcriptional regulator, redox-sensing transcriptional regulator
MTQPGWHQPVTIPPFTAQAWFEQAACAGTDPDAWYPAKGEASRAAKRVCARCPVTAECLDYALATNQTHGIWGGLSVMQRRRLARKDAAA